VPTVQISIGFILSITFLNFLVEFYMQIMYIWCKCRCRLGYSRMLCHSE